MGNPSVGTCRTCGGVVVLLHARSSATRCGCGCVHRWCDEVAGGVPRVVCPTMKRVSAEDAVRLLAARVVDLEAQVSGGPAQDSTSSSGWRAEYDRLDRLRDEAAAQSQRDEAARQFAALKAEHIRVAGYNPFDPMRSWSAADSAAYG